MQERSYRLLSKDNGPYELLPVGWSVVAAALGLFWAIANGLLDRYVLLAVPGVALLVLSPASPVFGYLALLYFVLAYWFYFPLKAFVWRERALKRKGYTLQAVVRASSASDALRKYAASIQSSEA